MSFLSAVFLSFSSMILSALLPAHSHSQWVWLVALGVAAWYREKRYSKHLFYTLPAIPSQTLSARWLRTKGGGQVAQQTAEDNLCLQVSECAKWHLDFKHELEFNLIHSTRFPPKKQMIVEVSDFTVKLLSFHQESRGATSHPCIALCWDSGWLPFGPFMASLPHFK